MTDRERLPNRRQREAIRFEHGGFEFVAGVGRYPDGRLGEIFIAANAKSGTAIEAWARDSAILASIAIQYGTPLETVRHALSRDEADNAASPLGALLDILAESEARKPAGEPEPVAPTRATPSPFPSIPTKILEAQKRP